MDFLDFIYTLLGLVIVGVLTIMPIIFPYVLKYVMQFVYYVIAYFLCEIDEYDSNGDYIPHHR